jgi:hypothetical protein
MGSLVLPAGAGAESIWGMEGIGVWNEGYDFELNLDETGGVAYAEVHFKTLTKKADGQ